MAKSDNVDVHAEVESTRALLIERTMRVAVLRGRAALVAHDEPDPAQRRQNALAALCVASERVVALGWTPSWGTEL